MHFPLHRSYRAHEVIRGRTGDLRIVRATPKYYGAVCAHLSARDARKYILRHSV
jgi:hypothetical protein